MATFLATCLFLDADHESGMENRGSSVRGLVNQP